MAELLGGLGDSPEMTQQLESLVKELGSGGASSTTSTPAASGSGSGAKATPGATSGNKAGEDKFQEQIRRTMERMQASGEQASAAAASSSGNPDDILAQMLAEMEKGDFGGDFGSDEDFSKMLMGMMEQLTNKEILYEPMKELHDKFPGWMAKNRDKTEKADLERYEEQQRCVKDIVERFERPGYTDDSTVDREYIVERMQKVCQLTSVVGSLADIGVDASGGITAAGLGWRHELSTRGSGRARSGLRDTIIITRSRSMLMYP